MASPKNKREVQRLIGRVAALDRFISRSTDKCLPFYDILRGNKRFEWSDECEDAFKQRKHYLATPPVLAKPVEGEPLFLYIAVSATAVSGVLIWEELSSDGKIAYAVVTSARKLRPYFQSHTIVILTTFPIRTILHSPSQSERLAKWAVELSEYDIDYCLRTSAKSQVLADFLVELPTKAITNKESNSTWLLHVDGSSSKQGSGISIRLTSPTGEILEQSFRLEFHSSNNEAEYEVLIAGSRLAHGLKIRNIHAYCDSQLVASKYSGEYESRDERMEAYLKLVQNLSQDFDFFALTRIPRSENTQADALAALASSSDPGLNGKLPPEKWTARKIRTQAARYVTVDGEIYKWKFSRPLMTCLEGDKARKVMEDVHSGSCGNHSGGRSLAVKIKCHGYYWPTMIGDCEKFTRNAKNARGPLRQFGNLRKKSPPLRHRTLSCAGLWISHGVPYEIVTDNGSQFISTRFKAFCEKWKIRLNKSTPRYPQCNRQAETINKTVLDGLKKRLDEKKGRWAEELEGVLWSHRTTPRCATGETPFALVYGTECMIPAEVEFPGISRRLLPEREEINNAMLLDNLDLVNEQRVRALTRI
ncbi:uncharacterized protein LOC108824963 [Raphanus sativus]|uniref:Uncharacterized protein LOC108824963 n=1 Tax=Raphanus sativus TaxID=3726 RepID=A0A6J0L104_RAPSA|nr:uncharacterized protein LOC108824963 [Raphanus sativus]